MSKTSLKAHSALPPGLSKFIILLILASLVSPGRAQAVETVKIDALIAAAAQKADSASGSDYLAVAPQAQADGEARELLTVQRVLLDVCQKRSYGEQCGKTLLGMLWKESRNEAKAIGDYGNARGYFQIWYRLHKISIACAEDLRCSAEWSLDYLEQNGYPKYVNYAVQCHNGCNINNGYAGSARRWGERLWKTPLAVEVALAK